MIQDLACRKPLCVFGLPSQNRASRSIYYDHSLASNAAEPGPDVWNDDLLLRIAHRSADTPLAGTREES